MALEKPVCRAQSIPRIDRGELKYGDYIARGGFGFVRKAVWEDEQNVTREVAVKGVNDPTGIDPIINEARIMHDLSNGPNICQFYGLVWNGEIPFLIIQLLTGGTLQQLLTRGSLAEDRCRKIAQDIATALAYLKEKNVLHRDVKSANILFKENGVACLTDFGLALKKTSDSADFGEADGAGTLGWMAPETLKLGNPLTCAVDPYAFGVVLWEMVTGKIPFDPKEESKFQDCILNNQCLKIPDGFSVQLVSWMMACWQTDPASRPSAQTLIDAIEANRAVELTQSEFTWVALVPGIFSPKSAKKEVCVVDEWRATSPFADSEVDSFGNAVNLSSTDDYPAFLRRSTSQLPRINGSSPVASFSTLPVISAYISPDLSAQRSPSPQGLFEELQMPLLSGPAPKGYCGGFFNAIRCCGEPPARSPTP